MKKSALKYFIMLPLYGLIAFTACHQPKTQEDKQTDEVKANVQVKVNSAAAPSILNTETGMIVN